MMFQPIDRPMPRPVPYTVEQVVELLYEDISLRDRVVIAKLSENELDAFLYGTVARTIRKEFGLYSGNTDLLHSCCQYISTKYSSQEDPVMVIIKELWQKAREKHVLQLVGGTIEAPAPH